jgi:hypothetical protein
MKKGLPYDGDIEAIEIAIETIDELLQSGRFPTGKKITTKDRKQQKAEREQLKRIADKLTLDVMKGRKPGAKKFVPTKSNKLRKYKDEFARTETLKIRISPEHLGLIAQLRAALPGNSTADIIVKAIERYGLVATHKGKYRIR